MKTTDKTIKMVEGENSEINSISLPFKVGNDVSILKLILLIVLTFFISELFTGFGYLSNWLLLGVFLIGIILVLPVCFTSYWVIGTRGLTKYDFDSNSLLKLLQLLGIKNKKVINFSYDEISRVVIKYRSKKRMGPFDLAILI